MKREFQTRIEGDDGILLTCKSYISEEAARASYDTVVREFRTEHANELNTFHAELVEVLDQESFEGFLHEGCECSRCGGVIETEEEGESSPNGSIHTACA